MLLHAHNPQWADDFHALASVISSSLQGLDVTLEHVGSTAVPGLAAKPIIDLDLVYAPNVSWGAITAALAPLGYVHVGDQGIPGREVFKRPGSGFHHALLDRICHHLYACSVHGKEYQRHVLFRDFLRQNETARRRYQNLKMHLAEEAGQGPKRYAALKEMRARSFVTEILAQALQSRASTR